MKNNQKYNSILTIMCCVTKYALFILTQNDIIAADFMKLFLSMLNVDLTFQEALWWIEILVLLQIFDEKSARLR